MRDKILDWWEVSYPNLRHIGEQGTCDLLIKYCNIFVCVCVIVSTSKKILLCSTTRHDANDLMTSLSVNKEHLCKRADWLLTPCIFVCVCVFDWCNKYSMYIMFLDWLNFLLISTQEMWLLHQHEYMYIYMYITCNVYYMYVCSLVVCHDVTSCTCNVPEYYMYYYMYVYIYVIMNTYTLI